MVSALMNVNPSVNDACQVLSDKGKRRAQYNRLRLALLEEKEVGEDEQVVIETETFWTRCSKCRLRHQFERKYIGKRLVCPSCEHFFVGVEVGSDDKEEEEEVGNIVAQKSAGMGAQKEVSEEEMEDWEMTSLNELVGKGRLNRRLRIDQKKVTLASKRKMGSISEVLEREEYVRNDTPIVEERRRSYREKSKNDDMMLRECGLEKELEVGKSQVKRKKKSGVMQEEVEKLVNDERNRGESEGSDELGGVRGEDGEEAEELTLAEIQMKASRKSKGKKDERKTKVTITKDSEDEEDVVLNKKRRVVAESGDLEVMTVEDSDFYDFDKDRVERSFKKGQVWAIYDDDDGMPRHYGLIDDLISVNPFSVKMSWLDFQSEGDERLTRWEKMGFHISCGKYKVARKDNVNLLNIFSHLVQCERAASELYHVYPRKGSIWALYNERTLNLEGRNSPSSHQRGYDIVLCLTSYNEAYGLSTAYLEKVDGYKAVFTRREIGYNAVRTLEKNDITVFSHQIPATKLSKDDAPQLTGDCWELDPASLPQDLLAVT
ncbi:hypothetical protein RND81_08G147500 [Saponaria officinalis]